MSEALRYRFSTRHSLLFLVQITKLCYCVFGLESHTVSSASAAGGERIQGSTFSVSAKVGALSYSLLPTILGGFPWLPHSRLLFRYRSSPCFKAIQVQPCWIPRRIHPASRRGASLSAGNRVHLTAQPLSMRISLARSCSLR
jgi:hypothetical protein